MKTYALGERMRGYTDAQLEERRGIVTDLFVDKGIRFGSLDHEKALNAILTSARRIEAGKAGKAVPNTEPERLGDYLSLGVVLTEHRRLKGIQGYLDILRKEQLRREELVAPL